VTTAIGAEVDQQALYERAQAIFSQDPVQINFSYSNVDEQTVNGFSQSVPGMGSMFVMFTILGGMAVLVREREQWTLQRLVVMPVSRAQIIGGKILMYFTLGMIQYVVVFAIGLVFGMDFGNSLLGLLLLAMAFSLATTALTFALATRMRTQGQASQLTTLLALSLAALGGAWWPLSVVPETMRIVGHLSPIAWVMNGFQDLLFFGGTVTDILPEVAILLAIAGGLFVIGVWGFKYEP
ncbi:MAG: ABC transporter permease, partial [Chloroflexota bacterium]